MTYKPKKSHPLARRNGTTVHQAVPLEVWQTVATKLAIMVLQRDSDDPPAMLEEKAYDLLAHAVKTEMNQQMNTHG